MLDRYSITLSAAAIHERYAVQVPDYYKPRYNACPTQLLPIITGSGPAGISRFYWGKPPEWAKNKSLSEKIINLKVETLNESPRLKKMLLENRCIVPADGFCLWRQVGSKLRIPHRFTLVNESAFSFAGIWEEFENNSGDMVHTFMIIMSEADPPVSGIDGKLPVILDAASEKIWLDPSATEAALTHVLATGHDAIKNYTVSQRIRSIDVDSPSLIRPTPPADQFGNLTLFDSQ